MFTSDKILNALIDSLSIEDLETLLAQKRKTQEASKPKEMSENEILDNQIRNEILKLGILYPPKN